MRHNLYAELESLPFALDLNTACTAVYHQLVTELGGELMNIEVSADASSHTVMINAEGDVALSAREMEAMINEQWFDIDDDDNDSVIRVTVALVEID